jgi:UDP-N-acetylglucosamine acyltransferase
MPIHPTALISSEAEIADDVTIGPYSIVEGPVKVATGCRIDARVILRGQVSIGEGTRIGPGAIIGEDPQSIGFDSAIRSGVKIGARNTIREYVTIHRSLYEGQCTQVGNDNFLMAGAHLGHDTIVGDRNVVANNCLLAGHVTLGNRCFLGGGSVFHQFIRIGDFAMARGNSAMSQDLPPYLMSASVNRIAGLNVVGLRRGGFDRDERAAIKRAFGLIYAGGLNLTQALEEAERFGPWHGAASAFLDFFRQKSHQGVCLRRFGGENNGE